MYKGTQIAYFVTKNRAFKKKIVNHDFQTGYFHILYVAFWPNN